MSRVVRATAFGGPEVLTVVNVPEPEPAAGEVRVVVRAIGVNPIDHKLYSGNYGKRPELLESIGNEVAGIVDAVGADVDQLSEGDEVIGYPVPGGAYADVVVVPVDAVDAKPAALSFEEAAGLLLTGVTAEHTLTATGVEEGNTVLVHAASGGVGSMAVQLAVLRGARVIGTSSGANADYVRSLGAEPVGYGAGLAERVRALAPDGIDAAIDAVGTDEALDTSVELVADCSRIATIAGFGRGAELGIKVLGNRPGADPGTEIRRAARAKLIDLAAQGQLRVDIARSYPLEEVANAHRASAHGHTRGKVVVVP